MHGLATSCTRASTCLIVYNLCTTTYSTSIQNMIDKIEAELSDALYCIHRRVHTQELSKNTSL